MAIAYNAATTRLTLTGGSSGSRLSLLNVINDATLYANNTAYDTSSLVKADASDGNGLSLWSANSSFTSNTASLNTSQWTFRCRILGGNVNSNNYTTGSVLRLNAHLDISAFLDSTGQDAIFFEDNFFIRCNNGCNWRDGNNGSTGLLISFRNLGNNTSANVYLLPSTSSTDNWTANRVTFRQRGGEQSGIVLAQSQTLKAVMSININTIAFDYTDGASTGGLANAMINLSASSVLSNVREIRCNLNIDPIGVSNLEHSGLQESGIFTNKIAIINPSKTNPLNGYTPDIRNYAAGQGGIGLISAGTDQTFRDWVVSDSFTYSGNLTAYNGVNSIAVQPITSFWSQRTFSLTFRQGLNGVEARARFTPTVLVGGSPSQTISAFNTNITTSGLLQVIDTFYGSRPTSTFASASYGTFPDYNQATTWLLLIRNETHLDTSQQYDFSIGNTGGSFNSALTALIDPTYTSDQSALTTISANHATSTITTTGNLTEDQMYDWMKWWLSQFTQLQDVPVSPLAPSGTRLGLTNWNLHLGGIVNAGTKLNSIVTTGSVALAVQATSAGNYASITANTISLGTLGTPSTWTSTYTGFNIAGTGTFTLSGLGALVSGGSVTTASVVTGTNRMSNITNIITALQNVLPMGSVLTNSSVGNTAAVINVVLTADGINGWYGQTGSVTLNSDSSLTTLGFPATVTAITTSFQSAATVAASLLTSFNGQTHTGWTGSSSANGNTTTITFTGPAQLTSFTAPTLAISSRGGNESNSVNITQGTDGLTMISFSIPAVSTVVTPVPSLTSTISGFVITQSNASIVANSARVDGTTNYQSLETTATTGSSITGLPAATGSAIVTAQASSGSIKTATGGRALFDVTGATSTNYLLIDGSLQGDITLFNSSISNTAFVRISGTAPGGASSVNLYRGGAGNVTVTFTGTAVASNYVANAGITFTAEYIVTLAGTSSNSQSDIKVSRLWIGNTEYVPIISGGSGSDLTLTFNVPPLQTKNLVCFVDGFDPVATQVSVDMAQSLQMLPIDATSLSFSTSLNSADTTFISGSSITYTVGSPSQIDVNVPGSTQYPPPPDTGSIQRTKLTVRRIQELPANSTYHKAIAEGNIPANLIVWNQYGYGVRTTPNIRFSLIKAVANNTVVQMILWITAYESGSPYAFTSSNNVQTYIQTLLQSPGSVLLLTPTDRQEIAGYAVNGIMPEFIDVYNGVSAASKLIPWNPPA